MAAPQCAIYNGLLCIAHATRGATQSTLVATIVNTNNGNQVVARHVISTNTIASYAKVIADESNFYIAYMTNGVNEIYAVPISVLTLSLGTPQLVVATATFPYDIAWRSSTNRFYLAYKNSGTTNLELASYSALTSGTPAVALTAVNTATIAEVPITEIAIQVHQSLTNIFVAYSRAGDTRIVTRDTSLGAVAGPSAVVAVPSDQITFGRRLVSGNFILLVGQRNTQAIVSNNISTAGVVSSPFTLLSSYYRLASKVLYDEVYDREYVLIGTSVNTFGPLVLIHLYPYSGAPYPRFSVVGSTVRDIGHWTNSNVGTGGVSGSSAFGNFIVNATSVDNEVLKLQ